jgi:branched-chain amino acid transport system ATP-binding protein
VLGVEGVSVAYGGLRAVEDVSLSVRDGEIVGLIGPNGAGKTTLFNAIAGFVAPATGRVLLEADDVTGLAVHERAVRGVGRTFQTIQLSPELTVFDNLLVATHVRNPSGLASHLLVTRHSARAERHARDRVRKVVHLLELDDVLDRQAAGLPFGVLRMVELGRALVTGAPLIMLDEPVSGLDDAETDRFAGLLRYVRASLGVSVLVIEHDVRMVMALCDYVYVLDRGRLISEGPPLSVQKDEAVVAAYLGEAPAAVGA